MNKRKGKPPKKETHEFTKRKLAWLDRVMDGLSNGTITHHAYVLAAVLASFSGWKDFEKDGFVSAYPSQEKLAERVRLSERQVRRLCDELKDNRFLKIGRRGRNSNLYEFCSPGADDDPPKDADDRTPVSYQEPPDRTPVSYQTESSTGHFQHFDRTTESYLYKHREEHIREAYEEKTSEVAKSTEVTNSVEVAELSQREGVVLDAEGPNSRGCWLWNFASDRDAVVYFDLADELRQREALQVLAKQGKPAARAFILQCPWDDGPSPAKDAGE